MIGIIGKKLGMTQIFNEQGQQVPVTVIEAAPNPVTKVVDTAAAGYASVELGHAPKAGLEFAPRVLRSFRLDDAPGKGAEVPSYNVGDTVTVGIFAPGERVKVTGTTKGRGFQGVVKRWGFGGGPNTHGNTKHRRPGSIGPGTDPSRVIKGKKMPGHYGAERHTQIGLRVEKVDAERNLVYVRGAVPGATGGIVVVRKQG